jgi:CHAT domain-containing protein
MQLKTGLPQQVSLTRSEAIAAMQNTAAPIVYFYCHGGLDEIDGPYIEVGPRNGPRIARNNLRDIQWRGVRPIVIINGCHTTRVAPEEALELVSAFVTTAGASGVMGTEITIFDSLATSFAEAFLEEFVNNARPAGEAVRHARLRLLKDSLNPLGLVYIPFVPSDLRLYPLSP